MEKNKENIGSGKKRVSSSKRTTSSRSTKSKNNKHKVAKSSGKKRLLWTIVLIAVLAVFGSLAYHFIFNKAGDEVIIKVPRGATLEQVEDSVAKYLGESYAAAVKQVIITQKVDLSKRNGAYKISEGMSPARAARVITHGGETGVKLVIRHLRTKQQLAEFLADRLDMTEKEFLAAYNDPDIQARYKLEPEEMIALFMEDTYEVYWSTSPADLIDRMAEYYNKFWNSGRCKDAEKLGLSPEEVMTLASIVDEETSKVDEKGTIGRLYINRLNKGMRLQADPTAKFASGDFNLRRVTNQHTKINSPYNTYRVKGLPPGPIGTTNRKTIDAILDSPDSDYLYMCAKEDFSGYHNFAVTYEEHQHNAKRYRKALDERGIK